MNSTDNKITFMDAVLYAMEGENPSKAIENQERRGQQSVISTQILPKKSNEYSVPREIRWNGVVDSMDWEEENRIVTQNNVEYTKQQYERMGVAIIKEYDDLFWEVILPEGWEIKETEHRMWNHLFDAKGRRRAAFFFKASFHDRDAFINFSTRFHAGVDHTADADADYSVWKASDYQGTVKDCDRIIFSTECVAVTGSHTGDDAVKKMLKEKVEQYMKENYPNYEDVHAYWD